MGFEIHELRNFLGKVVFLGDLILGGNLFWEFKKMARIAAVKKSVTFKEQGIKIPCYRYGTWKLVF